MLQQYEHYFVDAPKLRMASYAISRIAKSGKRKLGVDYEKLRRILGHVPMEVVEQTIKNSTQLASRNAEMPIHRQFKTKFSALRLNKPPTFKPPGQPRETDPTPKHWNLRPARRQGQNGNSKREIPAKTQRKKLFPVRQHH